MKSFKKISKTYKMNRSEKIRKASEIFQKNKSSK